jgi:hypothetical protein
MDSCFKYFVGLMFFTLVGCESWDLPVQYQCNVTGEFFRYRDAKRISKVGDQSVSLELKVYRYRLLALVSHADEIDEFQNQKINLDQNISNDVEFFYKLEFDEPTTHQRTVSSLVLNKVSGDLRLFHHRWVPPAAWEDSDMYLLKGECRK